MTTDRQLTPGQRYTLQDHLLEYMDGPTTVHLHQLSPGDEVTVLPGAVEGAARLVDVIWHRQVLPTRLRPRDLPAGDYRVHGIRYTDLFRAIYGDEDAPRGLCARCGSGLDRADPPNTLCRDCRSHPEDV